VNVVLLTAGALLVLAAVVDAVMTTLTAGGGAGPVAGRVGRGTWRLLMLLSRRNPGRLLSYAGAVVLLITVLAWVALLWAGWFLIFLGAGDAVVEASTNVPASAAGVAYYAGFVVFTLGVGDVVAVGGAWRILTALASFIGLFVVTLAITYLISVVSAAVTRRQLAREVSALGSTGPEVLLTHWTGEQFASELSTRLDPLRSQLLQTVEQHLAYPVLHFFHASDPSSSAPRAMATLDDVLLLLDAGVDPSVAPGQPVLGPLRQVLQRYVDVVQPTGSRTGELPPLPLLEQLRAAGVPVTSEEQFAAAASSHADRRRALHRLVRSDAWSWPTAGTGEGPSPRRSHDS
jgi:hypothetical protein